MGRVGLPDWEVPWGGLHCLTGRCHGGIAILPMAPPSQAVRTDPPMAVGSTIRPAILERHVDNRTVEANINGRGWNS